MSTARLRLMLVSTNLHCLGVSVGKVIDRVRRRQIGLRLSKMRREYKALVQAKRPVLLPMDREQFSDKPTFVLIPAPPEPRKWWELWR